jgi:hypothetical protein
MPWIARDRNIGLAMPGPREIHNIYNFIEPDGDLAYSKAILGKKKRF